MLVTKQNLLDMGVKERRADRYLDDLNKWLTKYKINTPLRVAHFISQVLHESSMMRYTVENLNYSTKGLRKTFRKYFSADRARRYSRQPQWIGNRVYANRMGNGDENSGDGYAYRGRGLIQLTGENNYRKFAAWIDDGWFDVFTPSEVATKYAVASAVFYWDINNLNKVADRDSVHEMTKRINGGYNGLEDRKRLLSKAKRVFHV